MAQISGLPPTSQPLTPARTSVVSQAAPQTAPGAEDVNAFQQQMQTKEPTRADKIKDLKNKIKDAKREFDETLYDMKRSVKYGWGGGGYDQSLQLRLQKASSNLSQYQNQLADYEAQNSRVDTDIFSKL